MLPPHIPIHLSTASSKYLKILSQLPEITELLKIRNLDKTINFDPFFFYYFFILFFPSQVFSPWVGALARTHMCTPRNRVPTPFIVPTPFTTAGSGLFFFFTLWPRCSYALPQAINTRQSVVNTPFYLL